MNVTKKEILELTKNAKIDRLEMLYIDLTLVLRRLDKQKPDDSIHYVYYEGLKQGYIECLNEIERNIKALSESKV